jgi:hypothetical protein
MESRKNFLNSDKHITHSSLLGADTQSPFKLPTDEEVFIAREAERLQRQDVISR